MTIINILTLISIFFPGKKASQETFEHHITKITRQ